jgi:CheY-like chemotaxis protein
MSAERPHILFADDESDIRELVQYQLEAAGYRVSTAENAAEVLRLIKTEHFDALLLDYWMQEETGIELCYQIRKFDQSTPVLICSGANIDTDKEAAALPCVKGYIRKPIRSQDLIRALRSLLKVPVDMEQGQT